MTRRAESNLQSVALVMAWLTIFFLVRDPDGGRQWVGVALVPLLVWFGSVVARIVDGGRTAR